MWKKVIITAFSYPCCSAYERAEMEVNDKDTDCTCIPVCFSTTPQSLNDLIWCTFSQHVPEQSSVS